jgi:hypothetical protein
MALTLGPIDKVCNWYSLQGINMYRMQSNGGVAVKSRASVTYVSRSLKAL